MQTQRNIPYPIRMPNDLRQALQRQADEIGRSLHQEIIKRLQQSVKNEQQTAPTKRISKEF